MRCPFCRHPSTSVVDSRAPKPGFVIRRRRQCPACGKRFTTFERVAIAMPWIIKRGGGRVEYNRAKLRGSMQLALRKRPVSSERIDAAVGAIEHKLSAMGEREVRSSKLGELVLEAL
ncbi:MAG: transcriptional regulator NrdR, partial [Sutterella sp. 54_7]